MQQEIVLKSEDQGQIRERSIREQSRQHQAGEEEGFEMKEDYKNATSQAGPDNSTANKRGPNKESDVYDYYLDDLAKSKQKCEAVTQEEIISMRKAYQDFMLFNKAGKILN